MMTNARIRDLNPQAGLALFFVAGVMLPACSGTTANGDPSIPAKYAPFATAFDQERQQLGVSGASVALIENGEVTFAHGFGTKGPNSHEPVDANTLFRIGSMTKALTATALLGLVDSGTLSSGRDADERRAGRRDRRSRQSRVADAPPAVVATVGALRLFRPRALRRTTPRLSQFLTSPSYAANEYFMDPPGTFYNYANPNFDLAGLALERAGRRQLSEGDRRPRTFALGNGAHVLSAFRGHRRRQLQRWRVHDRDR